MLTRPNGSNIPRNISSVMLKCSEPTYSLIGPAVPFCRLLAAAAAARFFSAWKQLIQDNLFSEWCKLTEDLLHLMSTRVSVCESVPGRPGQWWELPAAFAPSVQWPKELRLPLQTRCMRCPLTCGSSCQRSFSHRGPAEGPRQPLPQQPPTCYTITGTDRLPQKSKCETTTAAMVSQLIN